MKRHLFIALFAATMIGAIGCTQPKNGNSQNATAASEEQTMQNVNEEDSILGVFSGTLPCADCGGKKMSLTIANDGTYHLEYEYLDKSSEGTIEENGTYNVINDSIIETITPSSGNKTYYVRINEDLMLSDSLGTINQGELANLYILKKQ